MVRRLKARYSGNALIPQEPCDIPEGAVVDLIVQGASALPPETSDPAERTAILRRLVERMQHNRLPSGAPRLTRDDYHERR